MSYSRIRPINKIFFSMTNVLYNVVVKAFFYHCFFKSQTKIWEVVDILIQFSLVKLTYIKTNDNSNKKTVKPRLTYFFKTFFVFKLH